MGGLGTSEAPCGFCRFVGSISGKGTLGWSGWSLKMIWVFGTMDHPLLDMIRMTYLHGWEYNLLTTYWCQDNPASPQSTLWIQIHAEQLQTNLRNSLKKDRKTILGFSFTFSAMFFNEGHSILCIQWQMKLLAPQNLLQFCWEPVGLLGSKMMHWESKKVITTRITICIMDKTWDEWDMDLPMAKSPNHVEVWKQNATVSTAV